MNPTRRWLRNLIVLIVLTVTVTVIWHALIPAKPLMGSPPDTTVEPASHTLAATSVEVVAPRAGGITRICTQPGTLEPIQAADLYAKVSGFLIEQTVDIGDAVQAGDILARISLPEYEKQVKQDAAEVTRAKAKVDQMIAAIATAEADLGSATAAIALAKADQKSKASFKSYREKQWDRIKGLVAREAIDAKLADEQQDHYESAVAAESAAHEAIVTAQQKEAAAKARIIQAKADKRYAESEIAAAEAKLERSQVLLDYTVIRSPYTGVVTKRNFHPGDFVRSADSGGERTPLLAVERTDIMRVVVQVPERDVPFVDLGDAAIVEVDALPGIVFKTNDKETVQVSRLAASEDPHSRMMRTEVHIRNPEGKLRRGMYGRATIILQLGLPGAVRIPSAAMNGKIKDSGGTVRVIRDGVAHLVKVRFGADNGSEVEVVSGLTPADLVVVRATGPLNEGDEVTVAEMTPAKAP